MPLTTPCSHIESHCPLYVGASSGMLATAAAAAAALGAPSYTPRCRQFIFSVLSPCSRAHILRVSVRRPFPLATARPRGVAKSIVGPIEAAAAARATAGGARPDTSNAPHFRRPPPSPPPFRFHAPVVSPFASFASAPSSPAFVAAATATAGCPHQQAGPTPAARIPQPPPHPRRCSVVQCGAVCGVAM